MNYVARTMCYPPFSPDVGRRQIYDCLKRYKIHSNEKSLKNDLGCITSICFQTKAFILMEYINTRQGDGETDL